MNRETVRSHYNYLAVTEELTTLGKVILFLSLKAQLIYQPPSQTKIIK